MCEGVRALPVRAKAEATPTRAENPVFDAAGFVIAYLSSPLAARSAMSRHVTSGFPSQPHCCARLRFTPSTTGDSMMGVCARILPLGPAARVRYRALENQ